MSIFGLSFERPYLMKGLNLMHPKYGENCGFRQKPRFSSKNHGFRNPKTAAFKIQKLQNYKNRSLRQMKDHLPKKVTSIFLGSSCVILFESKSYDYRVIFSQDCIEPEYNLLCEYHGKFSLVIKVRCFVLISISFLMPTFWKKI